MLLQGTVKVVDRVDVESELDRDEEIDLLAMVAAFAKHWKLMLVAACALELLALVYLNVANKQYMSVMVVAPASEDMNDIQSGLLGSFGSALGLLGAGGQSDFSKYRVTIHSNQLAQKLVEDEALASRLFPSDWNAEEGEWRAPRGVVAGLKGVVKALLGMGSWAPPNYQDFKEEVLEKVYVSLDNDTGFLTVAYENADAALAQQLLERIHIESNELIRENAEKKTRARIDYIERILPTKTLGDDRDVLTKILLQEGQKMMMVKADSEFAGEMVEEPNRSQVPSSPQPFKVLFMAGLLGVVLGAVVGFLGNYLKIDLPGSRGLAFRK